MKNLANNNSLPVGVCIICWVFYNDKGVRVSLVTLRLIDFKLILYGSKMQIS